MTDPHAAETLREMREGCQHEIEVLTYWIASRDGHFPNGEANKRVAETRVAALDTALQALALVERLAQDTVNASHAEIRAKFETYHAAARAVCPGPPEER